MSNAELVDVTPHAQVAAGTPVARAARPAAGGWPARGWFMAVGIYLLVYMSWQLFHWLPSDATVGHVITLPMDIGAPVVAWLASRWARGSQRTVLAWRLFALALVGQLAGGLAGDVYALLGRSPYPSLADPLYLSFYPLMLAALLVLPQAPQTRSQHIRLALDLTITALGAATVIWYVLIAPTARAGGQSSVQMAFSLAYPVGDMILVVGVASLLLRGVDQGMRRSLWLLTAGLCLFIVGDVLYAYATLHSLFQSGDPLDINYEVALSLFVLAACCRGPVQAVAPKLARVQKVSWMPYLAVAAGFAVLVISELQGTSRSPIVAIAAATLALLVSVRQLVAQRELVVVQQELRGAQAELVDAARQAGMAEIATNVLHNVGNVLNSVNVSADLVGQKVRGSKSSGLAKAVVLIDEHADDLGAFLTTDVRGKHLPQYLGQLATTLADEREEIERELLRLTKGVAHIKEIVSAQQSLAGASDVLESVTLDGLIDDAVAMADLADDEVTVTREIPDIGLVTLDRHRVLLVLLNLIGNARHAMKHNIDRSRQLNLRAEVIQDGHVLSITVADNGEGIPEANLTRIFVHGFTTHVDGHGFGLHSSALAAKEIGGELTAQSDGAQMGALFTLEVPLDAAVAA
jgi:signal transduction histidine kinase